MAKKRSKKQRNRSDQQPSDLPRRQIEAADAVVGLSAPVQAIEANHRDLARRLGARADRYSQLLARALVDEQAGTELLTRSGLTPEEHAELSELAPEAHALFQQQAADALTRLR